MSKGNSPIHKQVPRSQTLSCKAYKNHLRIVDNNSPEPKQAIKTEALKQSIANNVKPMLINLEPEAHLNVLKATEPNATSTFAAAPIPPNNNR